MKKTTKQTMKPKIVKIEGIHTKKYIENLKATYKDEKVVFIMSDGREIKWIKKKKLDF